MKAKKPAPVVDEAPLSISERLKATQDLLCKLEAAARRHQSQMSEGLNAAQDMLDAIDKDLVGENEE